MHLLSVAHLQSSLLGGFAVGSRKVLNLGILCTLFSKFRPNFCRSQNTKKCLWYFRFCYKIKLILHPRVKNFTTHLTLYVSIPLSVRYQDISTVLYRVLSSKNTSLQSFFFLLGSFILDISTYVLW